MLSISLDNSIRSPDFNSLVITLPGSDMFMVDIPAAMEDSPFQSIGIYFKDDYLVVVVNCTVIDVVGFMMPDAFPLTNRSMVQIFGSQAIVSH